MQFSWIIFSFGLLYKQYQAPDLLITVLYIAVRPKQKEMVLSSIVLFSNIGRLVSVCYTLSSVSHVFWFFNFFLCWSDMLILNPKYLNTKDSPPNKTKYLTQKLNTHPPKKYGRQFLWGTDNKVYQNTVPNWHYPPYNIRRFASVVQKLWSFCWTWLNSWFHVLYKMTNLYNQNYQNCKKILVQGSEVHTSKPFQASFLVCGGSVINGAYPV